MIGCATLDRRCLMLVVLVSLALADGRVIARDYYVRQSGRNSNDGRTPQTAWATLDRVFEETLLPGDTVYVGGGAYLIQRTIAADGGGTPSQPDGRDDRRDDDRRDDDRRDDDRRDDDRRDDDRRGTGRKDDNRDKGGDRRSRRDDDDDKDKRDRNGRSRLVDERDRDDEREDDRERRSSSLRSSGRSSSRSGRDSGSRFSSDDDDDDDDDERGNRRTSRSRERSSRSRSGSGNSQRVLSISGNSGRGRGSNSNGGSSNGGSGSEAESGSTVVTFVGDSSGRFTGDRGRIVLSPQADGWCMAFLNFGPVAFDGFSFETDARSRRRGSGLSATGPNARLSFTNCSFSNLETAVFVQQGEVVVSGVTFDGVTTGIATEAAQLCECRDCEFSGTAGWAIDTDSLLTTISQSTFSGENGVRIGTRSAPLSITGTFGSAAVDAVQPLQRRDAVLAGVTFSGTRHGVLAENLDSLDITLLKADGCREWGVFASGSEMSLTHSTIENGANGVCLNGAGAGHRVTVSHSTIAENTTYGLLLNRVGVDVETSHDLTIRNNGSFGLGVVGADLTLTNAAGFELSGNGYGLYSREGNLDVSGLTLDGNWYGISQTEGQLVCRDVTITGSGTGLQQINGTQLVVEGTTVSGARDWGIHVRNELHESRPMVTLRGLALNAGGNGLYVSLPATGRLTLSDSELSGNSGHGLLSRGADMQLQRVSITGNQTGVQHTDGALSIQDSTVSRNSGVGISVAGVNSSSLASLTARRNFLTGNQRALSAWNVNAAVVLTNLVRGNSYGLQTQTIAGVAEVWNNTLVDNRIGIFHGAGRAIVRNNVVVVGDGTKVAENTIGIFNSRQGTLDLGANLVFGQSAAYSGTAPGAGDVLKPPRFVDYAAGDFRLAKGSPAINAGVLAGSLISRDLAGVPRPMFEVFEIGAYEYPEKDGSLRIVEWTEKADAPAVLLKSMTGR
jgi:hypothetical protein